MAAFFGRGELILEMHGGGARAYQGLGQFECVEVAAKARLRVGDDRDDPVGVGFAFHVMNLVGPQQRIIDALDHARH